VIESVGILSLILCWSRYRNLKDGSGL